MIAFIFHFAPGKLWWRKREVLFERFNNTHIIDGCSFFLLSVLFCFLISGLSHMNNLIISFKNINTMTLN